MDITPEDIIFNNPALFPDDPQGSLDLLELGCRVSDALCLQDDERDLMFMLRTGWDGRA